MIPELPRGAGIVVLTGAGISRESGLHTFRDADGIWARHRIEDVATPEAFARDPATVLGFYTARRAAVCDPAVQANAAHLALAKLDAAWPGDLLIVTQNVDDLHERAGAKRLVHMHGELLKSWCRRCDGRFSDREALSPARPCPSCGEAGGLRPDVVWFGEMPYRMAEISEAIAACDLFVSIGTSGNVYPAAGYVREANAAGAFTLELNLEPSEGRSAFRAHRDGQATVLVPAFVDALLAGAT